MSEATPYARSRVCNACDMILPIGMTSRQHNRERHGVVHWHKPHITKRYGLWHIVEVGQPILHLGSLDPWTVDHVQSLRDVGA